MTKKIRKRRPGLLALLVVAFSLTGYAGPSGESERGVHKATLSIDQEFREDGQTGTLCMSAPSSARQDFVVWPVSGTASPDRVVAPYGPRWLNDNYDFHAGIDIPPVTPGQTVLRAAMDGRVVRKFRADAPVPTLRRFGNWVMLRHANGPNGVRRYTTYLHMTSFLVNLGDVVRAGQPVGIMGRTGEGINTEHLHFEYYEDLTTCGISLAKSRSPFGLPLPIEDQDNYRVQLGRIKEAGSIVLRAEIPGEELDIVEFRIQGKATDLRVDLNEKIGVAPSPCTKCCDQALSPDDNVVHFRPQRFTGGETFVFCINVDNADVAATYMVTLRDAKGQEVEFGPFSAEDTPADVSDCLPSAAPGCSDVRARACDVQQCREQE